MLATKTDEIKAEIKKTRAAINRALNRLTQTADKLAIEATKLYINRKTARLWYLQDMLRREEAPPKP